MELNPLLITGGNGFLGAWLLAEFHAAGYSLRATHRLGADFSLVREVFKLRFGADAEERLGSLEWVKADLYDIYDVESALAGCQGVVHAAGRVDFNPKYRKELMRSNVVVTRNLVNEALASRTPFFVYISSIAALGRGKRPERIDENRTWKRDPANTSYAVSKYLGEMEVWRGAEEGLKVLSLLPSIILGRGLYDHGSGNVFRLASRGLSFAPPGKTGFVGVEDCARATLRLVQEQKFGERYILNAENWTWLQLLQHITQNLQVKSPQKTLSPVLLKTAARLNLWFSGLAGAKAYITPETALNACLSNEYRNDKILADLPGFAFQPLEELIRNTCAHFRELHPRK